MSKVETMDKNVKQLTPSNTAMKEIIQTLHEAQLSMDNNMKILMLKMGIKENTRAAALSEEKESITWIHVDETNTEGGDE